MTCKLSLSQNKGDSKERYCSSPSTQCSVSTSLPGPGLFHLFLQKRSPLSLLRLRLSRIPTGRCDMPRSSSPSSPSAVTCDSELTLPVRRSGIFLISGAECEMRSLPWRSGLELGCKNGFSVDSTGGGSIPLVGVSAPISSTEEGRVELGDCAQVVVVAVALLVAWLRDEGTEEGTPGCDGGGNGLMVCLCGDGGGFVGESGSCLLCAVWLRTRIVVNEASPLPRRAPS